MIAQIFIDKASFLFFQRGQIKQRQDFARQVLPEKIGGNLWFAKKVLENSIMRVDNRFRLLAFWLLVKRLIGHGNSISQP